ncbi:FHA domain protein [Rosistilla oblonga]|uniref:FHA domain protein n=3 Tax=Rosistilla TaxID=2795779 RepID=A0A518IRG5_9BACT|nr:MULTISPECIES: FHA domain-containing protein [Rosistilla]QDS87168.1 FHA domain protein [Rosistilla ulvae]QDV11644.1 FHA domain protein [Rosistilla oblonga]QDV55633.1 FHA domain protein [Rosistilla oblonga]QDV68201.1 FHA domain protein [Rosistilla carotiformis]
MDDIGKVKRYGMLEPSSGGDPVPLLKERLTVGRRDSCDICLKFANISGQHCRLTLENGYWFARDMDSRNGTKVNGSRILRKRLDPGSVISFAKHEYTIEYNPQDLGAFGPPPPDEDQLSDVLRRSLMDRAGMNRRSESNRFKNEQHDDLDF